jgi:effector-binding domain-containing protein
MGDAVAMLREVGRAVAAKVPQNVREKMVVVAYSDFEDDNLDLEIGFSLTQAVTRRIVLSGTVEMSMTELPAVERLATVVRSGPNYQSHLGFGALGLWMEANRCRIAGPSREVFLEPPFQKPEHEDAVVEIQFPVTMAAV